MLIPLLRFELKYHFKQVSFQIAALLFLILGMFTVSKANFGDGTVFKNSAYVSTYIISFLSLFSIFSSTLFCANVVLRDSIYKMDSVIFTTAVKRRPYFTVRFLGLLIAVFIHLAFAALGLLIGTLFVESAQLGPFRASYYLQPLFIFGFPNVLLSVSCIFCTAVLTKNVRAIYATGVLLYIIYMVASILGNSPLFATSALKVNQPSILPYLFDPYAMTSFFSETKKWTDVIRNYQLFPINGVFLANRLIWFSISIIIITVSYKFFKFRLHIQKQSKQKPDEQIKNVIVPFKHFAVFPKGLIYNTSAFISQFKLEVISLFKHIPFMVMLLLWVFVFSIELKDSLFNGAYGIHVYPTTGFIIEEMRSTNFALILIIFYAAELVGREKSTKIEALIYSTPVRSVVLWGAKCLTLAVLVIVLVSLNISIGIGVQLVNGFFKLELLNYLSLYYYSVFPLILFVILIVGIQNLTGNKYLGLLLNMIVVGVFIFAPQIGITHYMFRFAAVPNLQYSYFNGFGHYANAFNWYMLYWIGFTLIIGILTVGMWQGGTQQTFPNRLKSLAKIDREFRYILVIGIITWIGSGTFIYYQTNVIGKYTNKQAKLDWKINYEKRYSPFINLPQPTIKSVKTNVDLLIDEGVYIVKGSYKLKNETNVSITKVWVSLDQSVNSFNVFIPNSKKQKLDKQFNQQFLYLNKPLAPNAEMVMQFNLRIIRNGFAPFDTENSLVSNGTYIELEKYVPHFGYDEDLAVDDKIIRKKAGLPVQSPGNLPQYNYQLIDFETTISTPIDQQVVTVGTLQKTWATNRRRYFNYKTQQPIAFMFALSSARYELKKERHGSVELSIYYLKGHEYNLNTIMKAIKETIDYANVNFGKYPLKHFVLAEIPHYRGAATAYPGLVFSTERINFLSNYTDPNKVNQSYAITVHEVAHQWWANALDPAHIPGRATLSESLAKYTEAMLIEKEFGKVYLSNYFRLDNHLYFISHNPNEKEQTLAQSIDQGFVYYQKGGLTMYSVKEALGERTFNAALRRLMIEHKSPNKRATTNDFIRILEDLAPIDQRSFLENSFNQVVNYQMNIKLINCKAITDGKYKVELQINVGVNKQGANQLLIPNMDVDIALFDKPKIEWNKDIEPIYLKKYRIHNLTTYLTIIVNKKPEVATIDPYAYLLDMNLEDNIHDLK